MHINGGQKTNLVVVRQGPSTCFFATGSPLACSSLSRFGLLERQWAIGMIFLPSSKLGYKHRVPQLAFCAGIPICTASVYQLSSQFRPSRTPLRRSLSQHPGETAGDSRAIGVY